jgi:hypothetical protein
VWGVTLSLIFVLILTLGAPFGIFSPYFGILCEEKSGSP